MPGIAGFVATGLDADQARRAAERLGALVTREGSNRCEGPILEGVAALQAHNGLLAGRYPARAGSRSVWLDGELFDRRSERTDAEDLLARWSEAGDDWSFLAGLDGVYAAVLVDDAAGRVHLVSDRLGMRILFWGVVDGRLCWSSQLGGFLAMPGFEPVIERDGIPEFFTCGHLLGERTWFRGVHLLSPGTVVTFDLRTGEIERRRYWWWDGIKPQGGRLGLQEAARETGRLLQASVAARARPDARVGVSLSGGLDSRALFAAVPGDGPVPALTFGRPGCVDLRVAARVAALRPSEHVVVPINAENWFAGRSAAVWWTDGLFSFMQLHGIESADMYRRHYDINLDGFGGDFILGGMYLNGATRFGRFDADHAASKLRCERDLLGDTGPWEALDKTDYFLVEQRARRLNNVGTRYLQTYMEDRKPFLARDLIEFVYSLPDEMRAHGRLYRATLLAAFPRYYRGVAWAGTGFPISWPYGARRAWRELRSLEARLLGRVGTVGLRGLDLLDYTDYPAWLRQEPARGFVTAVLEARDALYPEYTSRDEVVRLWRKHLGGVDHARAVGYRLTFEIWLQQVFNGRLREEDVTP